MALMALLPKQTRYTMKAHSQIHQSDLLTKKWFDRGVHSPLKLMLLVEPPYLHESPQEGFYIH